MTGISQHLCFSLPWATMIAPCAREMHRRCSRQETANNLLPRGALVFVRVCVCGCLFVYVFTCFCFLCWTLPIRSLKPRLFVAPGSVFWNGSRCMAVYGLNLEVASPKMRATLFWACCGESGSSGMNNSGQLPTSKCSFLLVNLHAARYNVVAVPSTSPVKSKKFPRLCVCHGSSPGIIVQHPFCRRPREELLPQKLGSMQSLSILELLLHGIPSRR